MRLMPYSKSEHGGGHQEEAGRWQPQELSVRPPTPHAAGADSASEGPPDLDRGLCPHSMGAPLLVQGHPHGTDQLREQEALPPAV